MKKKWHNFQTSLTAQHKKKNKRKKNNNKQIKNNKSNSVIVKNLVK